MFRTLELKSLLKARTRALKIAENKIEELSKENKELKDLRLKAIAENYAQRCILKDIYALAKGNKHNNEQAIFNKIKELVETAHQN